MCFTFGKEKGIDKLLEKDNKIMKKVVTVKKTESLSASTLSDFSDLKQIIYLLSASHSLLLSAFGIACLQMNTVRDTASNHTDTSET